MGFSSLGGLGSVRKERRGAPPAMDFGKEIGNHSPGLIRESS